MENPLAYICVRKRIFTSSSEEAYRKKKLLLHLPGKRGEKFCLLNCLCSGGKERKEANLHIGIAGFYRLLARFVSFPRAKMLHFVSCESRKAADEPTKSFIL